MRWTLRAALFAARFLIRGVEGFDAGTVRRDPVIFALNHTTRLEALLVPALLMALRGGRKVHFLADWNFLLIPGLATVFRIGEVIPVNRKPARPRFLNRFRQRVCPDQPAHVLARARLRSGAAVGIFPEGTATHSPSTLRVGHRGAARLALETGAAVVPVGIRHQVPAGTRAVGELSPFTLHFGAPLLAHGAANSPLAERDFHARLMGELAVLSAKQWPFNRQNP